MDHTELLAPALDEARAGLREGGIPIGSALFDATGAVLGAGHNHRDTIISTTLAPCWFCSGLIRQFGIGTVVVGESRTFRGGIDWLRECGVDVVDLGSDECAELLQSYIAVHPEVWDEDIGE
jgi:creatinine deaminase